MTIETENIGTKPVWQRVKRRDKALKILDESITAYDLKLQGYSNREIAEMLGIGEDTARRRINDELSYLNEELAASRETFRALEIARLEELQASIWVDAMNGDLDAVDRILRIMQRRSKLLGLDQPVRVDVVDWRSEAEKIGMNPDDFYEWVIGKFTDALEGNSDLAGFLEMAPESIQDDASIEVLYEDVTHGEDDR